MAKHQPQRSTTLNNKPQAPASFSHPLPTLFPSSEVTLPYSSSQPIFNTNSSNTQYYLICWHVFPPMAMVVKIESLLVKL